MGVLGLKLGLWGGHLLTGPAGPQFTSLRGALTPGRPAWSNLAPSPFHAPSPPSNPPVLTPLPSARASQQRENLRELMFILVTPMSLSGVERLKEEASGESQKRSDSSSRSSSS